VNSNSVDELREHAFPLTGIASSRQWKKYLAHTTDRSEDAHRKTRMAFYRLVEAFEPFSKVVSTCNAFEKGPGEGAVMPMHD